MSSFPQPLRAVLITAALGISFGAGVALASIPDSSGEIHGCYGKNGDLRVIDPVSGNCRGEETALNWSQGGPIGPQGAPGLQGPQGPQGPAGNAPPINVVSTYTPDTSPLSVTATFATQLGPTLEVSASPTYADIASDA
jgi:hypothetical protein